MRWTSVQTSIAMEKSAPSGSQRRECYINRDAYFECLMKNDEDRSKCVKEKQKYESSCLPSWVSVTLFRKDSQ